MRAPRPIDPLLAVEASFPRHRRAAALTIAGLALLFLAAQVVRSLPEGAPAHSDFSYYYDAGRAVRAGSSPFVLPDFNYPAPVAFLAAPLGAMTYDRAREVWFWISLALVVAAALWTWRALGGGAPAGIAVAAAWASAGGIAVTLREGQLNAFLLPLLGLAIWPPGRLRSAGPAALGMAVALKLWPAILLWGSLLRRRWRELAVSAAWASAGIALPIAIVGVALEGPVAPTAAQAGYWRGTPAFLNSGLPAVALRLLDPPVAGERLPANWLAGNRTSTLRLSPLHGGISAAVFLAGLAGGLALVERARRSAPGDDPAALAAALISLALLVAPIVWPHYQMLQAPGAALLGYRLARSRRRTALVALGLAFLTVNWTEAVVLGPYFEAYGRVASHLPLVWLLSTLPAAGALAIFTLHLGSLRAGPGRPAAVTAFPAP